MMSTTQKLTLADYLSLETGSEHRCEFVDGEMLEMPPESEKNVLIAVFLMAQFLKVLPFSWVRQNTTEIVVAGRVRSPDLMILGAELVASLQGKSRSTITDNMPAPLLVVEVVSPGKVNEDRDYRYKRSEYAARGISEYWIVDPAKAQVTVLTLVDGLYEAQVLTGAAVLKSSQVPGFELAIADLMQLPTA